MSNVIVVVVPYCYLPHTRSHQDEPRAALWHAAHHTGRGYLVHPAPRDIRGERRGLYQRPAGVHGAARFWSHACRRIRRHRDGELGHVCAVGQLYGDCDVKGGCEDEERIPPWYGTGRREIVLVLDMVQVESHESGLRIEGRTLVDTGILVLGQAQPHFHAVRHGCST